MEETALRIAREEDAARLREIYAYYVERTAITFEWTLPGLDEFAGRMRRTMQRYPYLVAERGDCVEGFAYAGPFVGREAYAWSAETTIYLDPEMRHRGVGKQLYLALEGLLAQMGVLNLNACIGYPKEEDQYLTRNSAQFHQHLGYRMVGTFHDSGYKFGRWYDMVWMEKHIGLHPTDPAPVMAFHGLSPSVVERILACGSR